MCFAAVCSAAFFATVKPMLPQMSPLCRPQPDGLCSMLLPGAVLLSRADCRSLQTDAALIPIMLQLLPPLIR